MKFYYIITSFFILSFGFAQHKEQTTSDFLPTDSIKVDSKNNLIKFNVFILSAPNFSLQYERNIFKKKSVGISFNYIGHQKLPFYRLMAKRLGNHEYTKEQLRNISLEGYSISPEFRFYFGKENFKGFYISPFVKYSMYNVNFPLQYKVNSFYEKINFKGNLNAFTAGISLGFQWKIANNLYIDWLVIGPNIGYSNNFLHANKHLSKNEQIAINESLDMIKSNLGTVNNIIGIKIPAVDFSHEVNDKGAKIKVNEKWAEVKLSIGIGYRF